MTVDRCPRIRSILVLVLSLSRQMIASSILVASLDVVSDVAMKYAPGLGVPFFYL